MLKWVPNVEILPSGHSLMDRVFIAFGSRCIVIILLRTFHDDDLGRVCLSSDAKFISRLLTLCWYDTITAETLHHSAEMDFH